MRALDRVGGWPVGEAAVGVVALPGQPGQVGRPPRLVGTTGPVDRSFPWASVTKPVTALAVLVAVEEGTLDLDQPAGPPGSTVRHLLAHASGLGPDPGPGGLDGLRPLAEPGTRRIYSNLGYEVLARTLSQASGLPFPEYLTAGVLEPLGMAGVRIEADPERGLESGAAAGLWGPLTNLLAVAAELLVPTLVHPDTLRLASSVAFPGLAGVLPGFGRFDPCDWGLGVELRDGKQPHWTGLTNAPATYGHFGQSGSFLWVDPVAGVACAGLADRAFGPWAAVAWPDLADAVLGEAAGAVGGLV